MMEFKKKYKPDSGNVPSVQEYYAQAFVVDEDSETVIREVLEEFRSGQYSVAAMRCQEAAKKLRRGGSPRVLIVDVSNEKQPIIILEELAATLEPDVKVLVIGDRQDANFYRLVTRGLGAAEYLYKPLTRAMVVRFFGPFLATGDYVPDVSRGGRVLGVTSARGGGGSTTIAANLSWYLGEVSRRYTLAVDGDIYKGSAAVLLGVKTDNGLRAAFESPHRVDELFIERSAQKVAERCDLLSSQVDFSESVVVAENGPQHLIDVVRRKYNFIVIDVPNFKNDLSLSLNALCQQKIIVLNPTLPGLRDTIREISSAFSSSHGTRPVLVLNKSGQPGGLSIREIEGGVGRKIDVIFPYLPKLINNSEISGVPAASVDGPFKDAIISLAQEAASIASVKRIGNDKKLLKKIIQYAERTKR
ncbi:AAA family ATPase [Acetobacter sacchari]|uniref:AAA family ATPase n=1 Tax=Acetobacter sacchari TaxID=2661687 RepID=A0ABS3LY63_9PROT|nr:AAA family ATPase [Acetobacter sacchari]MBO1360851.1 AAA family ATPase [Acetobacter sacchari]